VIPDRLGQIAEIHRSALLDDVVPFWLRHSLDRDYGGYLTYLDREGRPYGTDKAVWLQGREVWLFATLYCEVERRPEWLDAARLGYDFILKYCFAPSGKMYFLVARDGRPLRMRRYVYSEVFGILASVAMARATGDEAIRQRAIRLFDQFLRYLKTPGLIEPKTNPQTRSAKGLAPLMCILCVADAMRLIDGDGQATGRGADRYEDIIDDAAREIVDDFLKEPDHCVLETVGPHGERLEGPDGRVMNPGHAIECGWFMLDIARRRRDAWLQQRALKIIEIAFERGWDQPYGGLLYFVDVDGRPATQLEHDMKLWWPHSEALIAALMAFRVTRDAKYARMYELVHEWTFRHFPDPQFGEWYGYLHRDGSLSTPLKGGPWKGAFHVPRCLLYCWRLALS
jgi:N-acylglucosamine 2-epimerase